jgi:hypothetical protein
MTQRNFMRSTLRSVSLLAGLAGALLLTACMGGSSTAGGKIQVAVAPIVAQMQGRSDSGSSSGKKFSPADVTGPGDTATTTDAQTLLVGAMVVDFTDTPLGPNTSIDDTTRDHIKSDIENSIKYVEIVPLPSSADFIEFNAPPVSAPHWQVFVAGTRDKISVFTDVKDDSVIWYGFNTDSNSNPFFLFTSTLPSTPLDVTLTRGCIASSNVPKGCAAFFSDRTTAVTDAVEITGVFINGDTTTNYATTPIVVRANGSGSACTSASPCAASAGATALANTVTAQIATATSVMVETTHQLSTGQSAQCLADTTAAAMRAGCSTQSYTTDF